MLRWVGLSVFLLPLSCTLLSARASVDPTQLVFATVAPHADEVAPDCWSLSAVPFRDRFGTMLRTQTCGAGDYMQVQACTTGAQRSCVDDRWSGLDFPIVHNLPFGPLELFYRVCIHNDQDPQHPSCAEPKLQYYNNRTPSSGSDSEHTIRNLVLKARAVLAASRTDAPNVNSSVLVLRDNLLAINPYALADLLTSNAFARYVALITTHRAKGIRIPDAWVFLGLGSPVILAHLAVAWKPISPDSPGFATRMEVLLHQHQGDRQLSDLLSVSLADAVSSLVIQSRVDPLNNPQYESLQPLNAIAPSILAH